MTLKPQIKTAALLFGVLLVLGGLASWDEWQTKRDGKKKETENLLLAIEPEKIVGIEFSNRESKDPVNISMSKSEGKWAISSPVSVAADQQAVDNLLTTLRDYKFEKVVIESNADLAAFGLDKPRRVIQLKTEKGPLTLLVGANAPVGYSVYASIEGTGKVYVGSQHLAVSTGKSLHDLRNKALLTLDPAQVTQLELIRPGQPSVTIAKDTAGSFAIIKPEALQADQTSVRNFLDEIAKANATAFFDNPDAKLKNSFHGRGLAEIRLKLADGKATNLKFIEADKKVHAWAGGSEAVAQLADDVKTKIAKTAADFRDRKIFSFAGDKAMEVVLDGKAYKKNAGDWHAADDATKPAPQIRSLLVDLEFAKASEIFALKDKAVVDSTALAAAHSLKISFDGGATPLEISLWEKKGSPESWLLNHSESKAKKIAYAVSKSSLSAIEPPKEAPVLPTPEHN